MSCLACGILFLRTYLLRFWIWEHMRRILGNVTGIYLEGRYVTQKVSVSYVVVEYDITADFITFMLLVSAILNTIRLIKLSTKPHIKYLITIYLYIILCKFALKPFVKGKACFRILIYAVPVSFHKSYIKIGKNWSAPLWCVNWHTQTAVWWADLHYADTHIHIYTYTH